MRVVSPLVDPSLFSDPGRRTYAGILLLSMTQAAPLLLVALLSVAMAQLPPGSQRMILGGGGVGLSNPDVAAFTQGATHALVVLAVLCLAGAALIAASLCRNASAGPVSAGA